MPRLEIILPVVLLAVGCGTAERSGGSSQDDDEIVQPTTDGRGDLSVAEAARLPAVSGDGTQVLLEQPSVFWGGIGRRFFLVETVTGRIVRSFPERPSNEPPTALVKDILSRGEFRSLVRIGEVGAACEVDVDSSAFQVSVACEGRAEENSGYQRGNLLEGFLAFDLNVSHSSSGPAWHASGLSNEPPSFERIPRYCRASFFPLYFDIFAAPEHGLLLVEQRWDSGSSECHPWRTLILSASDGGRPSNVRGIDPVAHGLW